MLSEPVAQFYIDKPETSQSRGVDLSVPHFILFEAMDDPFSGVVQKLFEYGQCPYERIEVSNNKVLKSKGVTISKLPALQFDGLTLTGFSTICRAIATRVGLDGCSVKESNEVDMIVNFVEAEMTRLRPLIQRLEVEETESDDDDDLQNEQPFASKYEGFDFKLAPILDARLRSNRSKTLVGKSLTWADYVLVYFMRTLIEHVGGQILDDYPDLAHYYHKNHAL
ncbi:unnamed protein product [Bursaphelenchus xylophilus]|uniref:(pine wood nematode) hypothetical protein n=1 Tax=Bursaphelenchus xylophilus TaxID=6326 RepID=A0A1I7S2N9_BURXY|nr:unnamed protein product [Bursaphelenchus xylophilus]CAG9121781.1 unnamed protein product [Bursaphelenchus xylophilus]